MIRQLHFPACDRHVPIEQLRLRSGRESAHEQMIHIALANMDELPSDGSGGPQVQVTAEDQRRVPGPDERLERKALELARRDYADWLREVALGTRPGCGGRRVASRRPSLDQTICE